MKTRQAFGIICGIVGLMVIVGKAQAGGSVPTAHSPQRLQIEKAMRDFQLRYNLISGSFVEWPNCFGCGGDHQPAPHFPKDKFYGEDLSEADQAALVKALITAWNTANLGNAFVKKEPENNFPTMATETPDISTSGTYRTQFGLVQEYLKKLKYVKVSATQVERSSILKWGFEATCEEAKGMIAECWDGSCEPDPVDTGPRIEILEQTIGYGGLYEVDVYETQGKISADLTKYQGDYSGTAEVYLKVEQQADGVSNSPPVSADPPGQAEWHSWQSADAGKVWKSEVLAEGMPEITTDCPTGGATKGWQIVGQLVIVKVDFSDKTDPGECKTCSSGDCSTGGSEGKLGCVQYWVNLGPAAADVNAGQIWINAPMPVSDLAKRSMLRWSVSSDSTSGPVDVVTTTGNVLRQVKTPTGLFDIADDPNNAYKYTIRLYKNGHFSTTLSSGLYPIDTGEEDQWEREITIENPDFVVSQPLGAHNRLLITERMGPAAGTIENKYLFVWNNTQQQWELSTGWDGSDYQRFESRSSVWNGQHTQRTETYIVRNTDSNGQIVWYETSIYQAFDWGEEAVSHIVDADGNASTTSDQLVKTWSYYEDSVNDGDNYTHLKQHVTDKGYWERYSYDSSGSVTQVVSQLNGSAAPDLEDDPDTAVNLLTAYTYQSSDLLGSDGMPGTDSNNEMLTTVVRSLNGTELSREYTLSGSGGGKNFTWQIQAASAAAAWDDMDNQASITFSRPYDGTALEGKPLKALQANGDGSAVYDLTIYTYTSENLSPYGTVQVTTTDSGIPNSTATAVNFGTRNVSKRHAWGAAVFDESYPINSGSVNTSVKLSSQVVPGDGSNDYLDDFGRVERVDYLDGTYTTTSYDCCGIDQMRGRDGLVTNYDLYDGLKRPLSITQAYGTSGALTTLYTYDAEGRVVQTQHKGTDQVEVTVETDTYDAAGRITSRTDANGNKVFYTYAAVTDSGKGYQETRTYPHDKSSGPIQVSWEDGQGQAVQSFTASTSASDWSGSAPAGDETLAKLSLSENDYDALGRQVTARNYYDLTNGLYYQTQTVYDFLGRSIRQLDPMEDVTATVYGDDGRPISQWRGTDATGATAADPSNGGANDMVKVSETFYDTDRDGTGDRRPFVTRQSQLKAASTLDYAYTDYEYDAKRRLEWTKPQYGPWVKQAYDEGDRPTEQTTCSNGSVSYILTRTTRSYDSTTKRLSSVQVHENDGTGGLSGNVLQTDYAYDDAGRQVKVSRPQGGFSKTGYDAQGRVAWVALCSEEGSSVNAANLTDDTVLTQTVNGYDDAGNLIQTTTYSRNHDATATGALSDTPSAARLTYKAMWYDKANRPVAAVDYGANAP